MTDYRAALPVISNMLIITVLARHFQRVDSDGFPLGVFLVLNALIWYNKLTGAFQY